MNRYTCIEINPHIRGEAAQGVIDTLTGSMRNLACEVSIRDLQKHLDEGQESYLVRVAINGKRLCTVRVVA